MGCEGRGQPDCGRPASRQMPVEALPVETLVFLLGSRYARPIAFRDCWQLFDKSPTGWARVQAICDYVNRHIHFGYEHARCTKTAWEAFQEKTGVAVITRTRHRFLSVAQTPRSILYRLRWATSVCRRPIALWNFAGGLRPTLMAIGTPLMLETISTYRACVDCPVAATRRCRLSSTLAPISRVSFKVWTDEVNEGVIGTAFS